MKELLSPRELAGAIGVSESSLRRWADGGLIRVYRTVGGHRRIALPEAIRFIRRSGATLVRPELLGLAELPPDFTGKPPGPAEEQRVYESLVAGDATRARNLILSLHLTGHSISALCDGPLRRAMCRIGRLWPDDPRAILVEHRAMDVCIHVLHQLHLALPPLSRDRPIALGGGPPTDPYLLPTLMAATVLTEAGYRAINYGPDLPLDLLDDAADSLHARLVWLSISAPITFSSLRRQIARLASQLGHHGARLIIGGREIANSSFSCPQGVELGQSMADLAAFARNLLARNARSLRATGSAPF